jgi:hypothetical protein
MGVIMKNIYIGIVAALLMLSAGCDEGSDSNDNKDVDLAGNWRYQISWRNSTATTRVETGDDGQITNESDNTSGDLALKLYFTTSKYEGGSINGYVMASKSFGTLEPYNYKYNISFANQIGLPPLGIYFVTLVLLENTGSGAYIKDYRTFDNTIVIYNVPYYTYSYYYYYY